METKQFRREAASRTPLYLRVLVALVVGNSVGYAAYLHLKRAPDEAAVNFTSTPPGAQVREGNVVLGVTPFSRSFPRLAEGPGRSFEFELAGYTSATIETFMDQEHIYVNTSLSKIPAPPPVVAVAEPVVLREDPRPQQTPQPPPVQPQPQQQARSQPRRVRHREVPRVADPEVREVPKLTEEETMIPKMSDEDRRVPKLDEDEPKKTGRRVPKL